jgi:hypothetical protein
VAFQRARGVAEPRAAELGGRETAVRHLPSG